MSTRGGGGGRREGQTEKSKGALDLGAFVRKNNSGEKAKAAFEKRMDKDPIGMAQQIVPPPRPMWQNTYRALEFLFRSFKLILIVFAGLVLALTWNQGKCVQWNNHVNPRNPVRIQSRLAHAMPPPNYWAASDDDE